MNNSYIYGRILGLFNANFNLTATVINNYTSMPHVYFAQLFKMHGKSVFANEDINARLTLLMDELDVDNVKQSVLTLAEQGQVQIGMVQEETFLRIPFAMRLRDGRRNKKLTQEELATLANLKGGKQTINKYENMGVAPRADAIAFLRSVLGYKYI